MHIARVREQADYRHLFDIDEEPVPAHQYGSGRARMRPEEMSLSFWRVGEVDKLGVRVYGPWTLREGFVKGHYVRQNGSVGSPTSRSITPYTGNLGEEVTGIIADALLALNATPENLPIQLRERVDGN